MEEKKWFLKGRKEIIWESRELMSRWNEWTKKGKKERKEGRKEGI